LKYLTIEEILFIHHRILIELQPDNSDFNILNPHALLSAINRPRRTVFGRDAFESIYSKAAALTEAIIKTHPFQDGNKRVGIVAGIVFMKNNGFEITARNDDVFHAAHNLSIDFWSFEDIKEWFENFFNHNN
jgi:death on curing protein